ncbi:MAG: 2-hydroxymuconate tautomerase family protein [Arenicella sp.]|nr:2-hydroxymuconate tautomerase family protein [Arenicella sp.]
MPIIQVNMIEGRTDEQKEALIAAIATAVIETLDAPEESVRVMIQEYEKRHFGIGKLPAHKAGR